MEFVIVGLIFEVVDGLLPICRQDVAVVAIKTLTDLRARQSIYEYIVVCDLEG